VDVKTGPAQFVVLYPEKRYSLPVLDGVAPLPKVLAAALPRERGLQGVPSYSSESWAALDRATAHYKPWPKTLELLRADRERLANSVEGEQNMLMARLGFTWGLKVKSGYVSAGLAYYYLCEGAARMTAWRPAEPWDAAYCQDRLRGAMLRGYGRMQ
jgi:hypothetical protein